MKTDVIINRDALCALQELPSESVHCCVTSPPYFALRDYGLDAQIGQEDTPEQYIDSKDYFSWEQYFAKLLIRCTENTYLQYRKSKLNETYLHEKNKKMILESIKGIKF